MDSKATITGSKPTLVELGSSSEGYMASTGGSIEASSIERTLGYSPTTKLQSSDFSFSRA